MGPTWVPSGAARTQVGPLLTRWTLLSGFSRQKESSQITFLLIYVMLVCSIQNDPKSSQIIFLLIFVIFIFSVPDYLKLSQIILMLIHVMFLSSVQNDFQSSQTHISADATFVSFMLVENTFVSFWSGKALTGLTHFGWTIHSIFIFFQHNGVCILIVYQA